MITTKQTAKIIESKLNALVEATDKPFRFFIHSNEGEYSAAIKGSQRELPVQRINGILLETMSTPVPLQGLNSVIKQETLQIIVPIDFGALREGVQSGGIDYVMSLLTAFVQDTVGLAGTETDDRGASFSYVLGISTPLVGMESYYGELGKAVPVTLSVAWQFIENGVLSNNAIFKLNGTPVVLMDGSIVRTRVGDTNNVDGQKEMTTRITQQGLTIKIVVPYKRGDVSETLMRDMLMGELPTVYAFEYDDGVITYSNRMAAREITSSHNAGKGITVTATLEIARG